MTQKRATPTVKRRRVGAQLRRWREAVTLKSGDAAKRVGWDVTRLSRIERGIYTTTAEQVRELCALYRVTNADEIDEVAKAAEEPAGTGWWAPYGRYVSQAYLDFIELEAEASAIRTQHPTVVPGLFQSPGYAREIISRSGNAPKDRPVEKLVAIRTGRQEVLSRGDTPVSIHALIPQGALHAEFSGPAVMREQLRRLIDFSELPGVTIQVVPLTTHPAYGSNGAVTLMDFKAPWAPVAGLDGPMGGTHSEDPEQVAHLGAEFDSIASVALTPERSRDLLNQHLEDLHS